MSTPDATGAKPHLAPDAPTAEGAHRVLWFQDSAGRRLPVAVTPAGDSMVLQIGANPTVALTLHNAGAVELGALLVLLGQGRTLPDLAAPVFDLVCTACAKPIEKGKALATEAGPIHYACHGIVNNQAYTGDDDPPLLGDGVEITGDGNTIVIGGEPILELRAEDIAGQDADGDDTSPTVIPAKAGTQT